MEYKEYAKQIEKSRPESPDKSAKIERRQSTDKGEPLEGSLKDQYIYDPATK